MQKILEEIIKKTMDKETLLSIENIIEKAHLDINEKSDTFSKNSIEKQKVL